MVHKLGNVSPASVLNALAENSVDGLLAFDREYRFTLWNAAMERISGALASDVVGRNAFEIFPHLRASKVESFFRDALAGVGTRTENYQVTSAEGTARFYDRQYAPLRDEGGAVVGGMAIVREVTERHKAESILREREELFGSILENVTEAIGIVGTHGAIRYANPALLALCGYTMDEIRVLPLSDLVHPDDFAHVSAAAARIVGALGHTETTEARWRTRSGAEISVHVQARSFADREGGVELVFHVRDVTEANRARQAVERAEAALRESERKLRASQKLEALGRLAGGVAHDVNNLLTVVTSSAELLANTVPAGAAAREYIEEITRASERGATLTQQLLTLGRKRSSGTRVIDLSAVVADLQSTLRRLVGERIAIETSFGEALFVRMDASRVEQVVLNLVVNARDAIGEKAGKIGITTRAHLAGDAAECLPAGDYVSLRVQDDGCGLSDEARAHMFEPFFTTKPRGRGTGLGLATVYGIVKQTAGHLNVTSELGKGSSFEVFFPRMPRLADSVEPPPRSARPGGHETILLADDEASVRKLLRRALANAGYEVLEAANGEEGMVLCEQRAARGAPVDLILSDVAMAGMGGRQLAARARDRWPGVRVLLMSGYDDREDESGPELPMLSKPFSVSAVTRRVRETLDREAS